MAKQIIFDVEARDTGAFGRGLMVLLVGVLILSAACSALVTASQRLAARLEWDHYVAGTVAEILSTLPELVVIAFLVPVSPQTAFVVALVTIYNNAVVFSVSVLEQQYSEKGIIKENDE